MLLYGNGRFALLLPHLLPPKVAAILGPLARKLKLIDG